MRDFRSSLLLLVSALLLIALGLLGTVCYHFYYKKPLSTPIVITSKETSVVAQLTRDTLQKTYSTILASLDDKLNNARSSADSINDNLESRLIEFYKLRQEITTLLQAGNPISDLTIARKKIKELQDKIAALSFINQDATKENKRLYAMLIQLKSEQFNDATTQLNPVNVKQLANKSQSTAINFSVVDFNMAATQEGSGNESVTDVAGKASQLSGTITVKKNESFGDAEIMLVVQQPDGKTLQPSAWESGSFETQQGRKVYTRKIKFDYKKGELKKIPFSISADDYQAGKYSIQVYQNGTLLSKFNKQLL